MTMNKDNTNNEVTKYETVDSTTIDGKNTPLLDGVMTVSNQGNEIAESVEITAMSPLQQVMYAKKLGLSIDEMKGMLDLQKEWEENEARKAFYAAMSEFKKNPPKVVKDALNKKFGSNYVSIGNMVNTVNSELGKHDLNARWTYPDDDKLIVVTCILSHSMGHEESVTLRGVPDSSGSKNPLQERKSTRTYLKLETFEAVTGMASISGNLDDDGNAVGQPEPEKIETITEDQALSIHAKITDNDLNSGILTTWLSKVFPYTQGEIDSLSKEHFSKVMAKIDESIRHKMERQENEKQTQKGRQKD